MKIKNIIFIPTIQHTGTWFLLKFLNKFIPVIKETADILDKGEQINCPTIFHTHFPIRHYLHNRKEEISKTLSVDAICVLSSIFKTVIPIRDPFAAILTRETRSPEWRHFYIVDAFTQVAGKLADNPNIKFFPIDLYKNVDERKILLIDTLNHCGIDANQHEAKIDKTANEWKPENITPDNKFAELYKNKDIEKINFLLGPKIAEIEYLKRQGSIFPFLVKLGYTREDLDLW